MSSLLQHLPSDEQLSTAVAAGDPAAFEELYRRYAGPLASYGARVLHDRSRGEDVAQTSLMRAYDALQRGTEPLRVKPWLYKIALNTALELKAKNGEVSHSENDEPADTSSDFGAARADILSGVRDLPERQQKVFVLREIKGLPVSEVARRLELTNQQVEQALFAARNRLAEVIVFGERVSCETLRGLDRSQLTRYERRAFKSHLRACPSCRTQAGGGFSAIGCWLRDAWAWLAGGGAGASAAKIGAVAVTATVVGGAPVVAPAVSDRVFKHESQRREATAVPAQANLERERLARVSRVSLPTSQSRASVRKLLPHRDPVAGLPVMTEQLADPETGASESPPAVETLPAPATEPEPLPERPPAAADEREPLAEDSVEADDAPPLPEEPVNEKRDEPRVEPSPAEEEASPVEPADEPVGETASASPEDVRATNASLTP